MKKLIAEQNYKKDRLSAVFVVFLVLSVVLLTVVRVVVANRFVEASEQLRHLDKKIAAAKETNQSLSENLREPQSVTLIKKKAKTLGFVKTNNLVFLDFDVQVALR